MNILITGIRGFIGFNAIQNWVKNYPDNTYIGLDACTYADQFMQQQKDEWLDQHGVIHYEWDLSNIYTEQIVGNWITTHEIDVIVHFAAESHVDNSIKNPNAFFQSNIIGTVNLLNLAKKFNLRFHQISTDEVYGETTPSDWQSLTSDGIKIIDAKDKPLIPSSPYSSSKASADMIALSYHRTFGTKVTVSRCSNNAGKYQHTEKLIGTIISKALNDEKIPVYGKGTQKRHWIDVDDHNEAIMDIIINGEYGKIYNIGPVEENWITNIELIYFILDYLKKPRTLIEHITDRLGHDTSYFLYPTKFIKTRSYKEFMPEIIEWYKEICKIEKQ